MRISERDNTATRVRDRVESILDYAGARGYRSGDNPARWSGRPDELVFSGRKGKALSDMTLTAALRRMKVEATAHGFRSTFRDWVAECTAYPNEVAEMALAHTIANPATCRHTIGKELAMSMTGLRVQPP
jgi:integrase